MGKEPEAIQREIEDTRERMGDRVDAMAYKADVPGRVGDRISEARDAVTGRLGGVKSEIADRTPDRTEVRERSRRMASAARENPLALVVGAAAAGFLVGMLLPSTRIEDERLGDTADQLKSRAAETGREAVHRGRQVAEDAAQAARESGGQQAGQLGEHARQRAGEVARTERGDTIG
ncbi:MAG TPA: DUF3618 domain-containing protein [Candidatus Dormibacteraeota bacterium]|nr:DUF3618 domain-containing protein [Candidatus Dormibacteraeota bacterium]